jgi:ribonucleoside-diphosphate reductase alpha chain
MSILKRRGQVEIFSKSKLKSFLSKVINIQPKLININKDELQKQINNGIPEQLNADQMLEFVSSCCASMSTKSYDYAMLGGRVETILLYRNTPDSFKEAMYLVKDILDKDFLKKLNLYDYDQHIKMQNDFQYDIIGIRTLERSYLLKNENGFVERPQYLLMRVAVFLNDTPQEAIETYNILSEKYYTHATPTLFHSGMKKHQLASCFLMPMQNDSVDGIFDSLKHTARISKNAGGIGISVSNIRAKGTAIKGTNGTSSGLVPMLRVFNNTARYIDQGGGKRKGSFAIFIEPWHADIQDVLKLKLNHGVENERARDLFYSLWIPDLFMKRVEEDGEWSLFCPTNVPNLQDAYGEEFNLIYTQAENSKLYTKQISARELWFQICDTQIETGTPYLCYKNAANKKSNQQNLGTIRSSNLCAEIMEYSSPDETAVCTLASICLPKFCDNDGFNLEKLAKTTQMVTINLNKVIDKTSYPVDQASTSNIRNRPIGIGVQGLSDVFQLLGFEYESQEAKQLNKEIFETIYYSALYTSMELSKINGPYKTFQDSPASNGILQFDMWGIQASKYDWNSLKNLIKIHGLRNSLLVACMPTASTAQINGNTESFEPRTSNIYVRRILSGEFIIINKYLEAACRKLGKWDDKLINNIIKNRGSVKNTSLPENMKNIYKTVWEMSNKSLIDQSADRGAFVCQSQSLNLYVPEPTRNILTSMHFYAWKKGLKTGIYYLRTQPKANAINFTVEKEECVSCSA